MLSQIVRRRLHAWCVFPVNSSPFQLCNCTTPPQGKNKTLLRPFFFFAVGRRLAAPWVWRRRIASCCGHLSGSLVSLLCATASSATLFQGMASARAAQKESLSLLLSPLLKGRGRSSPQALTAPALLPPPPLGLERPLSSHNFLLCGLLLLTEAFFP